MLTQVFIIAMFAYGWCTLFTEDHVFEKVGDWVEENLPNWIYKPLIECPICNAFWSGTAIYWWVFEGDDWRRWLLTVTAAMGVNAVFVNIINRIKDISDPPEE